MARDSDEEQSFLEAVRLDPPADAPRLIYADWLDENDDPERAEFIRAQCELEALDADDPAQGVLRRRTEWLWSRFGTAWRAHLPTRVRGCYFARGFPYPTELLLTPERFLALDPDFLRLAPAWRVRLHLRSAERLDDVATSPHLERLAELSLALDGVDAAEVEELLDSPRLRHLSGLTLAGSPVTSAHLRAVSGSKHLAGLRRLTIRFNVLEPAGAEILAGSETLRSLRALELNACRIGDAGLAALCCSPVLDHVRDLSLPQNAITAAGIGSLANGPPLRQLGLYANDLGDAGAQALALAEVGKTLTRLDLGMNRVGSLGGRALAHSPHLYGLKMFSLAGNRLAADTLVVRALRQRFGQRVTL